MKRAPKTLATRLVVTDHRPTKRSRKGVAKWHKKTPTAPVTGMADLDPLMVSLIAAR